MSTVSIRLYMAILVLIMKIGNSGAIQCLNCDKGEYLVKNCTTNGGKADCRLCQDGTYQPSGNHTFKNCQDCTKACPYNNGQTQKQTITRQCTRTNDITCECIPGSYDDGGACRNWTVCQPGAGVIINGKDFVFYTSYILDMVNID